MIYFISGHRNISKTEFNENYAGLIEEIEKLEHPVFVVGDYEGADTMAQSLLSDLIPPEQHARVIVFHMGPEPMNLGSILFSRVPGFTGDIERDSMMTEVSETDIAWVRPGETESGTAQNLRRREAKNKRLAELGISV